MRKGTMSAFGALQAPATNSDFQGRAQASGLFILQPMSLVSGKAYFVYVLWSASAGKFYIGMSEDPETRLLQHNSGVSIWTARHAPWEIVHVEQHENYSSARKKELLLKRQKGGTGFYTLTGLEPARFTKQPKLSGS